MNPDNRVSLGRVLPAYDVGEEIGRGSFGLVFAGRHRQLGREVAIKQLAIALADDATVRRRFAAEARLVASLDHPHIVPVYDYVEQEGFCLLVMERLTRGTVWDQFAQSGLTADNACAIAIATCSALEYAHRHRVLHRDVKPDNLLLSEEAVVKVTDFGIAEIVGGAGTVATPEGEILGTPAYMAPEQAMGEPLGPQADVYALAVVLYELLCGQLPFSDEGDPITVARRRLDETARPIGELADTGAELGAVVMRALAPEVTARFDSAQAFGTALSRAGDARFGAGWLDRSDFRLMAPGTFALPRHSESRAPSTISYRQRDLGPTAPSARPDTGAIERHDEGRRADPITHAPAQLVPVERMAARRRTSRTSLAVCAALLLCAVGVAWVGFGGSSSSADELGDVSVNGTALSSGDAVDIDFSEPIAVDGIDQGASKVELTFSVADVHLDSVSAPVTNDATSVELNAKSLRFFAAGETSVEMGITVPGGAATGDFIARPDAFGLLTVPGVVAIGVLLFVIAYLESLSRPLRRATSRRRIASLFAMGALGALGGAAIVVLVWALGGAEPAWSTVVVSAALTSAACVMLGLAVSPRRRRPRVAEA